MELSLKVLSGKNAGQEIKVPITKFFIGRADDCHLRPHSDMISRHHCVIVVGEGAASIQDFGSKNGTFLNGERIVREAQLRTGDRLTVGNLDLEVMLTSSVGGAKRPKVLDVKDAAQRLVSAGAGNDETKISEWLSQDDESIQETRRFDDIGAKKAAKGTQPASASTSDSTPNSFSDTSIVPSGKAPTPHVKQNRSASEEGKKIFGKLPPIPADAAKNSRDAAADMLKKYFKNR